MISFDALPLAFRIVDGKLGASGKVSIPTYGVGLIPVDFYLYEELPTGWDINNYARVFAFVSYSFLSYSNSPKRGWNYLYARNSFYNIKFKEPNNYYIESFNPLFTTRDDKMKIEITPKAREAMVVVMKMLRQETLNEREQLIAAKYQSQVQKVLKQKNNKY